MEKLPVAIYYGALPAKYEGHVQPIRAFRAEVNVSEVLDPIILGIVRKTKDIGFLTNVAAQMYKPQLEERVKEMVAEHDVDLVLLDNPIAEIVHPDTSTAHKVSDEQVTYSIRANGHAFKTTGIDVLFSD